MYVSMYYSSGSTSSYVSSSSLYDSLIHNILRARMNILCIQLAVWILRYELQYEINVEARAKSLFCKAELLK